MKLSSKSVWAGFFLGVLQILVGTGANANPCDCSIEHNDNIGSGTIRSYDCQFDTDQTPGIFDCNPPYLLNVPGHRSNCADMNTDRISYYDQNSHPVDLSDENTTSYIQDTITCEDVAG